MPLLSASMETSWFCLPVGLGGLLGGLQLLPGLVELGLDEALLADGALVAVRDALFPVDLRQGVGKPHGQAGVHGLHVDVDDPHLLLEVRVHQVAQTRGPLPGIPCWPAPPRRSGWPGSCRASSPPARRSRGCGSRRSASSADPGSSRASLPGRCRRRRA